MKGCNVKGEPVLKAGGAIASGLYAGRSIREKMAEDAVAGVGRDVSSTGRHYQLPTTNPVMEKK